MFGYVNGESGDVNMTVVSDCKSKLVKIYDGYEYEPEFCVKETAVHKNN